MAGLSAYAFSLLLLVAVEVAGRVGLGAQRWIELGPLALQPSELMKIALVLALARYLHGLVPGEVSKPLRLFVPLAMIAVPVVLVLMQPNLGTATLLALCGCLMLFLAGLSWYWIVPTLSAIALAVPIAWQFALHDYQKQRVMTFSIRTPMRWVPAGTSPRPRSRLARAVSSARVFSWDAKPAQFSFPRKRRISSSP